MSRSLSPVVLLAWSCLVPVMAWGQGKADAPPDAPTVLPRVNSLPLELSPEEDLNVRIYRLANRSVVNITTRLLQQEELLLLTAPRQGSGSGIVLSKTGHILTNNHVVEDAQQILVTLYDGTSAPAKLVGADPSNDLAVLKLDTTPEKLYPIAWGDSSQVLVGMRVFAIGNPFGLERTLTLGIVSSLNRTLRTDNNRIIKGIVQTDAAINPGNSGGPLLNRRGELIGINTAIVGRAGQSSGIGLAIPSNTARRVVDELLRYGRVIRPDLGIVSVFQREEGLLIARMVPGGPAHKAGLRGPEEKLVQRGGFVFATLDRSRADLIIAIDGKTVRNLDDLLTQVESKRPGEQVILRVIREGQPLDVAVTLELARN